MEPTRQPRQKRCAVNKRHVEMEITVCSAGIPYLPDTKQPVALHLNCGKWHSVVGTCHLEEVLHSVRQGGFTGRSF